MRVTLSTDEVETEARYLVRQGFRNILLVSGEHPKFVSNDYLFDVVTRVVSFVPSVSIEVAPMETEITDHWFRLVPRAWSSTRKRMTAQPTPQFTLPDQSGISIGDWKLRNARMRLVSGASGSLRYLG